MAEEHSVPLTTMANTTPLRQPVGSTLSSVQPYVADLAWNDIFAAPVTLVAGWNQVTWTVPVARWTRRDRLIAAYIAR